MKNESTISVVEEHKPQGVNWPLGLLVVFGGAGVATILAVIVQTLQSAWIATGIACVGSFLLGVTTAFGARRAGAPPFLFAVVSPLILGDTVVGQWFGLSIGEVGIWPGILGIFMFVPPFLGVYVYCRITGWEPPYGFSTTEKQTSD